MVSPLHRRARVWSHHSQHPTISFTPTSLCLLINSVEMNSLEKILFGFDTENNCTATRQIFIFPLIFLIETLFAVRALIHHSPPFAVTPQHSWENHQLWEQQWVGMWCSKTQMPSGLKLSPKRDNLVLLPLLSSLCFGFSNHMASSPGSKVAGKGLLALV